jgi:N-acetylmuramoyl-L-alanine amidase
MEKYYPNNNTIAEKLIRSSIYKELVYKIRDLNKLENIDDSRVQRISADKSTIKIPTLIEFQELMPSLILLDNSASLEIETRQPLPRNTTIISPGHGMNREAITNGGTRDPNGVYEINYIYRFTQNLYPAMDRLALSYVNLKGIMESSSVKHTVANKIDVSNEIYHSQGNVTLHFPIHADRNSKGYDGVTLIHIDEKPISTRIATFFADKLRKAGFTTRLMPDTKTEVGSLGELRKTDAPAAYIEIGSLDTPSSIRALNNRMTTLAVALAEAIRAFNIERPNR